MTRMRMGDGLLRVYWALAQACPSSTSFEHIESRGNAASVSTPIQLDAPEKPPDSPARGSDLLARLSASSGRESLAADRSGWVHEILRPICEERTEVLSSHLAQSGDRLIRVERHMWGKNDVRLRQQRIAKHQLTQFAHALGITSFMGEGIASQMPQDIRSDDVACRLPQDPLILQDI